LCDCSADVCSSDLCPAVYTLRQAADGAAGADGDLTRMREEPIPRFVRIPAREFAMGSNEGADDERPPHLVQVDTFYASAHAITIEQYAEVTRETAHGAPGIRDLPLVVTPTQESSF